MMNQNCSRREREDFISRFLISCNHKELTRAMKDSVAAERRYTEVAEIIPILAKEMPEGEVMPLMGLFGWEVEISKMSFFEGSSSYPANIIKSHGLGNLLKFMKKFKLVSIFSFCCQGEFSSSGCTLYVVKLSDIMMEKMYKNVISSIN